jgi:hypothetical protein
VIIGDEQMNGETGSHPGAMAAGRGCGVSRNWFVLSSGAVLALTGGAKVWSTFGSVRLLAVADPIAGIPFRWLLLAVGVLELVIAGICFFSRNQRLATMLVAWLATNFLVYRLGLVWMGWHRPCGCMGSLTSALHLSEKAADNIMKVVLAYLLIGSYGLLLWQWRVKRELRSSPDSPVSI